MLKLKKKEKDDESLTCYNKGCDESCIIGGKRCSGCDIAVYCDEDCQTVDWLKRHKGWCFEKNVNDLQPGKFIPYFIKELFVHDDCPPYGCEVYRVLCNWLALNPSKIDILIALQKAGKPMESRTRVSEKLKSCKIGILLIKELLHRRALYFFTRRESLQHMVGKSVDEKDQNHYVFSLSRTVPFMLNILIAKTGKGQYTKNVRWLPQYKKWHLVGTQDPNKKFNKVFPAPTAHHLLDNMASFFAPESDLCCIEEENNNNDYLVMETSEGLKNVFKYNKIIEEEDFVEDDDDDSSKDDDEDKEKKNKLFIYSSSSNNNNNK